MASIFRVIPFFLLALGMFYYPQEVVRSAADGLSLWWHYVLPALLPFFILSELLLASGSVHFMGVLMEPLMRPVFRLPGQASFVVAMSLTSGIPIGAILTTRLCKENALTQIEGERLLTFTCNPSPGFMFGAVASSMLLKPELGIVLVGSVYLGNLLVGILFRFYGAQKASPSPASASLSRAFIELRKAQGQDSRPFGQMFGDAVRQSVNTILVVGGFIVFFSVLVNMLETYHITHSIGIFIHWLSGGLITSQEVSALMNGVLEATLGCRSVIDSFSSLNLKVGLLAAVLGWGGLSTFAQVASFTGTAGLRLLPFVIGRILHSIFALVLSQLFLNLIKIPVFDLHLAPGPSGFMETWQMSSWVFCGIMLFFLLLSLGIRVFYSLK
ncbi:MAG TPA: sporulation integral membrane protein YlbJ [Desulfitobacterium dehalogenans]|uniref:Sporulation integral membrane protein YlbJ n=1 Tax=Desulfitobacterium dehalogenans TaxID=36854 RepID=A0A7C7DAS2_9FIRM|nr:sporulation integral membrane protein YlbJ [Desulfitobacterium dehalogenans]